MLAGISLTFPSATHSPCCAALAGHRGTHLEIAGSSRSLTPPMSTPFDIATLWKAEAERLGFALPRLAPAVRPPGIARFHEWLAAGYAGEMDYLSQRAAAYEHPEGILPGVRTLLVMAFPYRTVEPAATAAGSGRVSRYAWGFDYHDLVRTRLHALCDYLRQLEPAAQARGVIDTAPLLEREFAQLAGLGWIGKHTLLLNRELGSWFFLAAVLTDLDLPADEPFTANHCGTCTACLDACPTQAFTAPSVLDARRCISYLTIEHRSPIPVELRPQMGDWVLGCDVCQDVCPWNRKVAPIDLVELSPAADRNPLDLVSLFDLTEADFRQRFRKTPLWRPHRRGLLRNAAIALGNQRAIHATPALVRGLADVEPLVRGASAWALGKIGTETARDALTARREIELDDEVRAEIDAALEEVRHA